MKLRAASAPFLGSFMLFAAGCTQGHTRHQALLLTPPSAFVRMYFSKLDGRTLRSWTAPLAKTTDRESLAYFAAVRTVAGPPSGVPAIRFPQGTKVKSVRVDGETAVVDLSKQIEHTPLGGFAEAGEFKALVWTLTALPSISRVRIRVEGETLPTLPGGHFEIDEPLSRADW